MPIYDYKCSQCGEDKEVMHGVNDDTRPLCEKCGGQMIKQFSANQSFRFYGGGTYVQHTKGD